jgi:deoxycytidine triphosphate deaminase
LAKEQDPGHVDQPSTTGAVLGDGEIIKRVNKGEIFAKEGPHCWERANLRAARYDLRIAEDRLVVPVDAAVDESGFQRYPRGTKLPESRSIELHPGSVALISTEERFCMPWDVCGIIALRFEHARRGLVALAGLFVDPGFGQREGQIPASPSQTAESSDSEASEADDDERLHLLLANFGTEPITLRPRDRIASIQFTHVAGVEETNLPRKTSEALDQDYFSEKSTKGPELGFVRKLQESTKTTDELRDRLNKIEDSIDRYAVFGVFLIATALIAGFTSIIVSTLREVNPESLDKWLPEANGARAVVLAVLVLGVLGLFGWIFWMVYRKFESAMGSFGRQRLSLLPIRRRRQRIRLGLMTIREDEWTTKEDVALAVFGRPRRFNVVERTAKKERAVLGARRLFTETGQPLEWQDKAQLEREGLRFEDGRGHPRHRVRYATLMERLLRERLAPAVSRSSR